MLWLDHGVQLARMPSEGVRCTAMIDRRWSCKVCRETSKTNDSWTLLTTVAADVASPSQPSIACVIIFSQNQWKFTTRALRDSSQ